MQPPDKKTLLELLQESKLFRQFSNTELEQLISFSVVQPVEGGTTIIEEGVLNDKVYLLIEGTVDVVADGEFIIQFGQKGDLVGEMSVITHKKTTAAVIAHEEVCVLAISSTQITESGNVVLQSILYKIFLDILTEKLTLTTKQVKGFQDTKDELAISEDIISSVLESMSDGVVVSDSSGKILNINEAFVKIVGGVKLPQDFHDWPVILGLYNKDMVTPYSYNELPMIKAMDGKPIDFEEIYVKNDSLPGDLWLHASARPLLGKEEGTFDGVVVVFSDYTKKKNEELALIKAKEHAEATAKAKSEFLAIMSHELRTPLNGIIGMTDLLAQTHLDDEQKDCMESIRTSGDTLLEIVRNILDLSNLEAGTLRLVHSDFILKKVVDDAVKQSKWAAEKKQLTMVVQRDEQSSSNLLGDPERIQQILVNILSNAIKFSKKGRIGITIKSKELVTGKVEISASISDEGIGIPEEKISQLFDSFSQADTTLSRQFDGTGIGLSICKSLIELMGGKIWVETELGVGSTFHFQILTEKGSDREKAKEHPLHTKKPFPEKLDSTFSESFPSRILVAEDNAMNQKLIGKVLRKLGYSPIFAENGALAVDAARKSIFDLILMDLQMPEMDGKTASIVIHKELPESNVPKIIALTANVMDGIRESCLEAGMVDYMAKPMRMDKLAAMLYKWF